MTGVTAEEAADRAVKLDEAVETAWT